MKKVVLCAISLAMVSNVYSVETSAEELANLKEQMAKLEQQIKNFEKAHALPAEEMQAKENVQVAETPAPVAKEHKKHWKIPGTSTEMSIDGFFKLTCTKDVDGSTALPGDGAGAGRNFLNPRTIGLKGVNNVPARDFYMHARESRLAVKTLTPMEGTDLTTCIEFDFLGDPTGSALLANNYNPRLRRAFGQLGHVLIGQDWSTFVDLSSLGETVEANGPLGNCQIRQPLIRYTTDSYGDCKFSFALENSESEFITPLGQLESSGSFGGNTRYVEGIKGENRMPDFVAAMVYGQPWGHIQLAGAVRENGITLQENNSKKQKLGAFLGASVLYKLFEHDEIAIHAGYGSGCGRYLTDPMKAATYFDGERLHNQLAYQFSACYKHQWTAEHNVRSTVAFGFLRNLSCDELLKNIRDNNIPEDRANALNKYLMSVHANLMGDITPNMQVGLEYVFAKRKAETGLSGTLQRFVFAVKVLF